MRRIGADIALDVGVDLLGAGKNGFQPGDPQIGRQPTQVPADWLNTVQEELMAIPESAGIAQSTTDKTQVVQALKKIMQTQAYTAITTSGTAPTYAASITPVPTLATGLRVRAKFHAATTAASTLNLNGLGAKSIKQYDQAGAKIPAVIAANMLTDLEYDGTDWVVLNPINSAKAENFANSKTANGWQKLEGGLIIQWGTAGFAANNSPAVQTTVAFPIAFPNACVHISGVQISRASNDGGGTWAMRPTNKTLTNFLATLDNNGGNVIYNFKLAQYAEWIAIGY